MFLAPYSQIAPFCDTLLPLIPANGKRMEKRSFGDKFLQEGAELLRSSAHSASRTAALTQIHPGVHETRLLEVLSTIARD